MSGSVATAQTDDVPLSVAHRIEAVALRLTLWLFRLPGLDAASGIGGFVGRLIGPRLGITRRARRNLRLCFPDMPDVEIEAIIYRMWDNLGRTLAEYPHLGEFRFHEPGSRIKVQNAEVIDRVIKAGHGGIFVSGHLANWEILPKTAVALGAEVAGVYRAANNPAADRVVLGLRRRYITSTQVPKGAKGARLLVPWLRDGKSIAMLVDQKMNDGIETQFFGRPAMTAPAAAALALRYGVPILVALIRRTHGARFEIVVEGPLEMPDSGDRSADIATLTQEINDRLEDWIRKHPDQWLWLHRRWPES